ncbi:MAG: glycosyltransferase family 39 protein, partial [Bacteroidetes bacterium]|nr:glycosyltransferase family 39 protein [Bacteroidota bacterium]
MNNDLPQKRKQIFYLLFAIIAFSLFYKINSYPLHMEEPRRALISIEMLYSGDWVQPTIHGEPYYRKPPLYNWVMASFMAITGNTNVWVVRLTTVLSFLLLGLFHFQITKKWFGSKMAFWSTAILLTFGDLYLYFSRLAEIDLFFALLAYPAVVLPAYFAYKNNWWKFYLIPPIFGAMAFLTKGLPAIAFLGISYLVAFAVLKSWKRLLDSRILLSILVFSLPVLAYLSAFNKSNDLEQ